MKKVIKFLPLAAIVLGSGFAMATTKKMNDHNVYWDPIAESWEDLSPYLPENYDCDGENGWCTAFRNNSQQILDERPGTFEPGPLN